MVSKMGKKGQAHTDDELLYSELLLFVGQSGSTNENGHELLIRIPVANAFPILQVLNRSAGSICQSQLALRHSRLIPQKMKMCLPLD